MFLVSTCAVNVPLCPWRIFSLLRNGVKVVPSGMFSMLKADPAGQSMVLSFFIFMLNVFFSLR